MNRIKHIAPDLSLPGIKTTEGHLAILTSAISPEVFYVNGTGLPFDSLNNVLITGGDA